MGGGGSAGDTANSVESLSDKEKELYKRLLSLRASLAERTTQRKKINCAPWMVFNNNTLVQLARKRPTDLQRLKAIHVMGETKVRAHEHSHAYEQLNSGVTLTRSFGINPQT